MKLLASIFVITLMGFQAEKLRGYCDINNISQFFSWDTCVVVSDDFRKKIRFLDLEDPEDPKWVYVKGFEIDKDSFRITYFSFGSKDVQCEGFIGGGIVVERDKIKCLKKSVQI